MSTVDVNKVARGSNKQSSMPRRKLLTQVGCMLDVYFMKIVRDDTTYKVVKKVQPSWNTSNMKLSIPSLKMASKRKVDKLCGIL